MPYSSSCGCRCGRDDGITLLSDAEIPADWSLCSCTRCASGSRCERLIAPVKKMLQVFKRGGNLQNMDNEPGYCGDCEESCGPVRKKARREQGVVSRPPGKSGVRTFHIKTTRVLFFWRV